MKNSMPAIPEKKVKVLTDTVKHLFNTIGPDDILREEDGAWFFQDRSLTDPEKQLLIGEAKLLMGMKLWKILQMDVLHQANKKMFTESIDLFDLTIGKGWLYVLDCFRTRLESICKGKAIFNTKKFKQPV